MTKKLRLSKMQVRLDDGKKADGTQKYSNLNFPRISESASDEDIQAVGAALGSLQTKKVIEVLRIDENVLKA